MLQYYRKHPGCNKFKYDHIISKLIAINCVISIVTMRYNSINEVYTLDKNDSEKMFKFVRGRTNYLGFMTKLGTISNGRVQKNRPFLKIK